MKLLGGSLGLVLLLAGNSFAATVSLDSQRKLELQTQILSAFNRGGCGALEDLLDVKEPSYYSAISLSVIAFCQKELWRAVELFQKAEEFDPTHPVVARLHATYIWRRDKRAAKPLWEKVLLLARDKALRTLAREYLDGNPPAEKTIEIDKAWSYYGSFQVGGGNATNPTQVAKSLGGKKSSIFSNMIVNAGLHREFDGFFASGNYSLSFNKYFQNAPADLFVQDLDLPLSVRIGSNEDLRLRPFASHWIFGGKSYYSYLGVGVLGVVFRNKYKQRLQALVYRDYYQSPFLHPQEGYHYRCEYNWEVFPSPWFIRLFASVEHVTAGRDRNSAAGVLIPYSHNDLEVDGFFEYSLKNVILGLTSRFLLREDGQESRYRDSNGTSVTKRREDFQMVLEPSIAIPLKTEAQLVALYRYTERFSNWTYGDYQDKTFANHEVQLSIKVSLKSL